MTKIWSFALRDLVIGQTPTAITVIQGLKMRIQIKCGSMHI